jgi:S-adenosylmethionine decarboxylase
MMSKQIVEEAFGPHLMLDCRQCNPDKIGDLNFVFKFLDELPELIGMHKIIPPYVFHYSGLVPEDKGITGAVIIAESHLTFHSFVEKDYFFFDIFSCKPFDVELVVKHVQATFEVGDMERHDASRGRRFPRAVEIPASDSVIETVTLAPSVPRVVSV